MNFKVKKIILENEKKLMKEFPNYKQSINQFSKNIEKINNDSILYEFINRSFQGAKKEIQESDYNKKGFKSARQLISSFLNEIDLNDKIDISTLKEGERYNNLEICSIAENYNQQVGMYYLKNKNCVIIKSTVEDNYRPYDDRWFKQGIILKYYMQTEKEINVQKLIFSNTPNAKIFEALMDGFMFNVYAFINTKKGDPYKFMGIYHPCGLIDKNKAFLMYKDGYENEIPYDNLEAQFLMTILKTSSYPEGVKTVPLKQIDKLSLLDDCKNKLKTSKRNIIQQHKINLEVDLRGEDLVLNFEREKLRNLGFDSLANKVENVSLFSDSLGYDIKSFYIGEDGSIEDLYIKVKTSVGNYNKKFSLKTCEYQKLISDSKFKLYRVYDIYTDLPKVFIVKDNIMDKVKFEIESYNGEMNI